MGIRLTISKMEECIFLGKKRLTRIRLTISQMEEWICLDKKWLMGIQNLVMPPNLEECAGVEEIELPGRCMCL